MLEDRNDSVTLETPKECVFLLNESVSYHLSASVLRGLNMLYILINDRG